MEEQPKVVFWFRVYAGIMAFMYACVMIAGAVLLAVAPRSQDRVPLMIVGGIYIALGLLFCLAFALAFAFRPSPGAWVYGLVLICIGFMGCPTIAASIPLLIYWIKPETKRWYGRVDKGEVA